MNPGRRPRRLLVVPVVVVLAVIGIRLVTTYAFAAAGVGAYDGERFGASESSFRRLSPFNVIHPWRAHFGLGDARYRQGDLDGAEVAFARALELQPDRCDVRFNLAVTIEAQGDQVATGDRVTRGDTGIPDHPAERYVAAIDIIDAGDCPPTEPDDVGDRLATSRDRILAKLAAFDRGVRVAEEQEDTDDSAGDQRGNNEQELSEIEQRNLAATELRDEGRDRGRPGDIRDVFNW